MTEDQPVDESIIVIRPGDYRARLKEYALCMADDFGRNITLEINVDRSKKNAIIKVIVHKF